MILYFVLISVFLLNMQISIICLHQFSREEKKEREKKAKIRKAKRIAMIGAATIGGGAIIGKLRVKVCLKLFCVFCGVARYSEGLLFRRFDILNTKIYLEVR